MQRDLTMSHSLSTADRRTHGKILVVASAVAGMAIFAGFGLGRAPRAEATAKREVAQSVVKAVKPTATASRFYVVVR